MTINKYHWIASELWLSDKPLPNLPLNQLRCHLNQHQQSIPSQRPAARTTYTRNKIKTMQRRTVLGQSTSRLNNCPPRRKHPDGSQKKNQKKSKLQTVALNVFLHLCQITIQLGKTCIWRWCEQAALAPSSLGTQLEQQWPPFFKRAWNACKILHALRKRKQRSQVIADDNEA